MPALIEWIFLSVSFFGSLNLIYFHSNGLKAARKAEATTRVKSRNTDTPADSAGRHLSSSGHVVSLFSDCSSAGVSPKLTVASDCSSAGVSPNFTVASPNLTVASDCSSAGVSPNLTVTSSNLTVASDCSSAGVSPNLTVAAACSLSFFPCSGGSFSNASSISRDPTVPGDPTYLAPGPNEAFGFSSSVNPKVVSSTSGDSAPAFCVEVGANCAGRGDSCGLGDRSGLVRYLLLLLLE